MSDITDIWDYAKGGSRNRIVFCSSCIDTLQYVDVGHALALLLRNAGVEAGGNYDALCQKVLEITHAGGQIGLYTAIRNIGILFEPSLHLNIRSLIDRYSTGRTLFVCAEGSFVEDVFFYKGSPTCRIDLYGLSYKHLITPTNA